MLPLPQCARLYHPDKSDATVNLLITPKPEPSHATWSPDSVDSTTTTQKPTQVDTDVACGIYSMAGVTLTSRFDPTVRILVLAGESKIPRFQSKLFEQESAKFLSDSTRRVTTASDCDLPTYCSLPTLFAAQDLQMPFIHQTMHACGGRSITLVVESEYDGSLPRR